MIAARSRCAALAAVAAHAACGFELPPLELEVDTVSPANGASDVYPLTSVTVAFQRGGVEAPIGFSSILYVEDTPVAGDLVGEVPIVEGGVVLYNVLRFTPKDTLPPGRYEVRVPDTTAGDAPAAAFTVRPWRWTAPRAQATEAIAGEDSTRVLALRDHEATLLWADPAQGLMARSFLRTWGRYPQPITPALPVDHEIATAVASVDGDALAAWVEETPDERRGLMASINAGGYWSAPKLVAAGGTITRMSASAGTFGARLVAWAQTRPDGTDDVVISYALSDDDWAEPSTVISGITVLSLASMVGLRGTLLAWVAERRGDDGTAHREVWAYQGIPGRIERMPPTLLADVGGDEVAELYVVGDGDTGRSVVAWLERGIDEDRVRARRWSVDGGWTRTWTASSPSGWGTLRVAGEPAFSVLVWTDRDAAGRTWYGRLDDSGATAALDIAPALREPAVAVHRDGSAMIAGVTATQDIVAVRRDTAGAWSPLEVVAPAVAGARWLSSSIDERGRCTLGWIFGTEGDGAAAAVSALQ